MLYKSTLMLFASVFSILITSAACAVPNKQLPHTGNPPAQTQERRITMRSEHENSINTALKERDYWPTESWKTSSPQEQGMEDSVLVSMDQHIRRALPHVRGVVVIRSGYIVFEKYYQGVNQNDKYILASATKTFSSALIGIAIKQGFIKDTSLKLLDVFPGYKTPELDSRVNDITLEHLLTMSAGFKWNDNTDERRCLQSPDAIKAFIHTPFDAAPGQKFNYNTMGSYLLSAIITKTTKMKALEFADIHLFKPLGIRDRNWPEYQGYNLGGHSLSLKPRDMAKFGYLLLNNGVWDGKEVISADWVKEMTTVHNEGGSPHGEKYGYQCWITTIKDHPAYFAGGFGGQFILVVPDLDIVVAISSNTDRHHEENRTIVGNYIIPSIK